MKAMCFTGHRPKDLKNDLARACGRPVTNPYRDIEAYRSLSAAIEGTIRGAVTTRGVDTVITGGAQGIDQIAFWAAERAQRSGLPIRNVVYMPFRGQEERWPEGDGEPFGQGNYRRMLDAADEVVICGYNYDTEDSRLSSRLLHGRNHDMVDASELVVAVNHGHADGYDHPGDLVVDPKTKETLVLDRYREHRGGTAECVRYANALGRDVVTIRPDVIVVDVDAAMPLDPRDIARMPERERARQKVTYGANYSENAPEGFFGARRFLSNMYQCPVTLRSNADGALHTFTCAEAAFQAAKCFPNHVDRYAEFEKMDGRAARRAGRGLAMSAGDLERWSQNKEAVMRAVVRAKFLQNPELALQLVQTGDEELVEHNTWNDTEWGVCRGRGENKLGRILMDVRQECREHEAELVAQIPVREVDDDAATGCATEKSADL